MILLAVHDTERRATILQQAVRLKMNFEDLSSERSTTDAIGDVAAVVRSRWVATPQVGIILGTGLGSLADHITVESAWRFDELPHFARSTADGHRGRLLCGTLDGVRVIAMDGRFHAYEGYSPQQITFPVRVIAALGAQFLIVSNASGGLNPLLSSGDIMLMDDHVNLLGAEFGRFSERGVGRGSWPVRQGVSDGPGAPSYYSSRLLELTERVAALEQIAVRRGTYIAMLGPNYETRAEYRWLRSLGDVVGMSTVPEVLVAKEIGLPVIAFSMVTNVFRPDEVQQNSSENVIAAASNAEPKLRRLVTRLLNEWQKDRGHEDTSTTRQRVVATEPLAGASC